ncbi:MAG: hypothetical protein ABR608_14100 [Pseudonocardiaceae bacterium]
MKPTTKKYLTWIVIALVLFYVLRDPQQAADAVQAGLGKLQDLAEAVITFLQALAS